MILQGWCNFCDTQQIFVDENQKCVYVGRLETRFEQNGSFRFLAYFGIRL